MAGKRFAGQRGTAVVRENFEALIEDRLARDEPFVHVLLRGQRELRGAVFLRCSGRERAGRGRESFARSRGAQAGADIDPRNSVLVLFFVRRLSRSSIASTVERGLNTLRSTQTRLSSSGGSSNSSLRVPER